MTLSGLERNDMANLKRDDFKKVVKLNRCFGDLGREGLC